MGKNQQKDLVYNFMKDGHPSVSRCFLEKILSMYDCSISRAVNKLEKEGKIKFNKLTGGVLLVEHVGNYPPQDMPYWYYLQYHQGEKLNKSVIKTVS